jgi:2-polyprenyl-3-methyl-5-hydroxy-6-metoxy-1,4-benzoquinol methylase
MSETAPAALDFTGERFTPECVREMWLEHYARYAFATRFAAGKQVLDCACGEGFGAAMLSAVAAQVDAVDLSETAIAHATRRYPRSNLRFAQADALALPFAAGQFDLVVSFETLEHLTEHEVLLAEFARVLKADGILLISTPDKRVYSDLAGYRNEFHPRELYADEFAALLAREFAHTEVYGQKLLFQSSIQSLQQAEADAALHCWPQTMTDAGLRAGLRYDPMYLLAACARTAATLEPYRQLSHWFGDAAESVYKHYNDEIRKGIRGGQRIVELEAQVAQLQAQVALLSVQR